MIQGYSKYVPIINGFEKYAEELAEKLFRDFGIVDSDTLNREDIIEIARFLDDNDWETKANRAIWKSWKINQSIAYKEYQDTIGKSREVLDMDLDKVGDKDRKIGKLIVVPVLASVSTKRTAVTLHTSLKKSQILLQGRVNRVDKYLSSVTPSSIESSLSDIERMVGTLSTQTRSTKKQIVRLTKRLNGSTYSQKIVINRKIAVHRAELVILNKSHMALNSELATFISNRGSYTAAQGADAYRKLLGSIRSDITGNQQKLAMSRAMNAQSARVAATAQTEFAEAARRANIKKLDKFKRKGIKVKITISLSPAHDIIDICDDLHGTYNTETLPAEGLPPYHRLCQCDARIEKV